MQRRYLLLHQQAPLLSPLVKVLGKALGGAVFFCSCLASFGLAHAQSSTYQIQHVEPASWWVGMKHPELQLMVHGKNIAQLTPSIVYPGVTITQVQRTDNPNYLFIDVQNCREHQSW